MYSINSKRPHTVIQNLIIDLKSHDNYYLLNRLKRLVHKVNYFELNEIDYSILRLFVLRKISNTEYFSTSTLSYCTIDNVYFRLINDILLSNNKKLPIVDFLKYLSKNKETAIELQLLERRDDEDFLNILKYCEI